MAQSKTDRIFEAIENRILQGELLHGARLESLRQACLQYAVSKNIMVTVYDRLVARGLVISRQGAGFFVAHTPSMAQEPQKLQEAIDTVSLLRAQLDRPHTVLAGDGRPPENWLLSAVPGLTLPAGEGGYGTPHGLLALREYIAAAQLAQGVGAAPSQIVTTFGANSDLDTKTIQNASNNSNTNRNRRFSVFSEYICNYQSSSPHCTSSCASGASTAVTNELWWLSGTL